MKLKPWYDVVKPREDLREGKSQDASEFAVHLDRVRDGTARDDYRKPEQFFAKTFLAANLLDFRRRLCAGSQARRVILPRSSIS